MQQNALSDASLSNENSPQNSSANLDQPQYAQVIFHAKRSYSIDKDICINFDFVTKEFKCDDGDKVLLIKCKDINHLDNFVLCVKCANLAEQRFVILKSDDLRAITDFQLNVDYQVVYIRNGTFFGASAPFRLYESSNISNEIDDDEDDFERLDVEMDDNLKELNEKLEKVCTEKGNLEFQHKLAIAQNNELLKEIEELKSQREELNKAVDDLHVQLTASQTKSQLTECNDEKEEHPLTTQLTNTIDFKLTTDNLCKVNNDEQQNNESGDEKKQMSQYINKLEKNNEYIKDKLREANEKLYFLQRKIISMKIEFDEQENFTDLDSITIINDIAELKMNLSHLEEKMDENVDYINDGCKCVVDQETQLSNDYFSPINLKLSESIKYKSEICRLNKEIKQLMNDKLMAINERDMSLNHLTNENKELNEKLINANKTITKLSEINSKLSIKLNQRENQLNELNADLEHLRGQIVRCESKYEEMKERCNKSEMLHETREEIQKKCDITINNLQKEIQCKDVYIANSECEHRNKIRELEQRLAIAKSEYETLYRQYNKMHKYKKAAKVNAKLINEQESLKSESESILRPSMQLETANLPTKMYTMEEESQLQTEGSAPVLIADSIEDSEDCILSDHTLSSFGLTDQATSDTVYLPKDSDQSIKCVSCKLCNDSVYFVDNKRYDPMIAHLETHNVLVCPVCKETYEHSMKEYFQKHVEYHFDEGNAEPDNLGFAFD